MYRPRAWQHCQLKSVQCILMSFTCCRCHWRRPLAAGHYNTFSRQNNHSCFIQAQPPQGVAGPDSPSLKLFSSAKKFSIALKFSTRNNLFTKFEYFLNHCSLWYDPVSHGLSEKWSAVVLVCIFHEISGSCAIAFVSCIVWSYLFGAVLSPVSHSKI